MHPLAFGAFAAVLVAVLAFGPAAAASAASRIDQNGAASVARALPGDVNDFSFASFDAQYALDVTSDGRSTMDVVETLVADFPSSDQNRGIERILPNTYNDVSTNTVVTGVTDQNGNDVPYTADYSDGVTLSIGGDEYVHGLQTYVISYTVENVIRSLANGSQELYWNVNGVGWAQAFRTVTATVYLETPLSQNMNGDIACYEGAQASTQACDAQMDESAAGDGTGGYTFVANNLGANQTLTVAVGFQANTFVVPVSAKWAWWATWAPVAAAVLALAAAVTLLVYRVRRWKTPKGRGTVVPEYVPPAQVDMLLCGDIWGAAREGMSAALIQMAVSGIIRLTAQSESGGGFTVTYLGTSTPVACGPADAQRVSVDASAGAGWPAETEAERQKHPRVGEVDVLVAIFGHVPAPGESTQLDGPDAARGEATDRVIGGLGMRSELRGLRAKPTTNLPIAPTLVGVGFGLLALGLSITAALISSAVTVFTCVAAPLGLVGLVAVVALRARPRLLTPEGVLLAEYLAGNAMYIAWAEKDRLAFLQGALTAERIGADEKIDLYERMLPVAVLLGQEESWGNALGAAFAEAAREPDWFVGTPGNAFNVSLFAAQIGGLSSGLQESLTAPSSSGGAGSLGGGFAGGGGGGGGGGGR